MTCPISIYFHIPYCRNKCIYCDFYSGGAHISDWDALTESFLKELSERKNEWKGNKVVSVYLGGGTPSLMPADKFVNFISALNSLMTGAEFDADCEFTIEVNPEDVEPERIKVWKECGVNRISIGIQTFDDTLLNKIGRNHTSARAREALRILTTNFDNVSADLIFGLPGQTIQQLTSDLEILTTFRLEHISVYSLMYENGTALTFMRDRGDIAPIDDDLAGKMYQLINSFLEKRGFKRYETSNYAIPGHESRHNIGYWSGRRYLGIGPSAHSYDGDKIRTANPADLKGYIKKWTCGVDSDYHEVKEILTSEELREERIMLGLRMKSGLDINKFKYDFGEAKTEDLLKKAKNWTKEGYLSELNNNFIAITDKGLMISDSIILDLI